jgi:predicted HTH domain antitoxin
MRRYNLGMRTLTIELPEDLLLATGQSREEFVRDARFLLATKLFELGRLSSGKASELAGMNHVDFLIAVSRQGVAVTDLDEDAAVREFADG